MRYKTNMFELGAPQNRVSSVGSALALDAEVMPVVLFTSRDGSASELWVEESIGTRREWKLPDDIYKPDSVSRRPLQWESALHCYFVPFKHPVPWDKDNPAAGAIIGFICSSGDLYDPNVKDRAMGKSVERTVAVESSKGKKTWEVLVYTDGSMSCNCPAWKYQKGITHGCKHTKKVQEAAE